jgi:glyoxylase-like metal-dependent hydrolase (beta-lactamase superfamily II)
MRDYMNSLETLLARRERRFLPGHGGLIPDAGAYVRGLREHRLLRERAILDAVAAGRHRIRDIVAAAYPDIDEGLRFAAGMSTLAHLEDLVDRDIVRAERPGMEGTFYEVGSTMDAGSGASGASGSTSPPPVRS